MLKHALKLSKNGRAVYIIADNERHAAMLREELGDGNHGIKVETPESLDNFDWMTLTLRNSHPNCIVLVDHYAIERRFTRIWQMMHAFDSDSATQTTPPYPSNN
jgi:hypothetical protein